jgi:prepilin-type N-terminal cleavage/methylation domain-containing protein
VKQRGFTLIELMVVVCIIALVTGVVLPFAIGRVAGPPRSRAGTPIEQAPPSLEAVGAVRQPTTESSEFHVELRARQEIEGWKVRTRYHARIEASYVVRNQDGRELRLAFPFPSGMTEARSVSLALLQDGAWVEPAGVSYDLGAIRWSGAVEPNQVVTLRIAYESEGRDAFVYDVAGSGRTGSVRAEIALVGVERPVIPASSLSPTAVAPGKLSWGFDRLLTNQRIRVELPPGPSPLGRLVLLCQLAALAVLLFGAGFWYLSELDRPGRLDTFRWGHFLLLAGNYSLFFAVFAFAGDPRLGLALGGGVSLPLLYVHVSRFVDARFARTRVMPLCVITLGMVVSAVYLPWLRPALALATGALGAGFLTLTYRDFSARRIAHRDDQKHKRERARWIAEIAVALDATDAPLEQLADALAQSPPEPSAERARAEAVRTELSLVRNEAAQLKVDPNTRAVERIKIRLAEAAQAAQAVVTPLKRIAVEVRERSFLPEVGERALHCMACGAPTTPGGRHCPACGAARPEERACRRCGGVARLPLHLLREHALATPVHCEGCGAWLE